MARTLVTALLLLLVGCGDGGETTSTPSPTPQATVEPSKTDAVEPPAPVEECADETITGNVEVTIRETDFTFSPSCVIVLGGQSLEILNRGETLHNFSIEGTGVNVDTRPGEATRTEALAEVLEPGTHRFICKYHAAQGMRGEITLTEAG